MNPNRLIQMWQVAAKDLCLEIITPFMLVLSSGTQIRAELLLKYFGAQNGMLVINKYSQISSFVDEIVNEGYGFSVLDEPSENEQYSRAAFIEMLSDWGWSGDKSKEPNWLCE